MSTLQISNHGPLITASDFWGGPIDRAGKIFASVNAGAIRLLIPALARDMIAAARQSSHAVLSRGPWPAMGLADAVEIMWEDGSDDPYALHLSPESFDLLPGEPDAGREWIASWPRSICFPFLSCGTVFSSGLRARSSSKTAAGSVGVAHITRLPRQPSLNGDRS